MKKQINPNSSLSEWARDATHTWYMDEQCVTNTMRVLNDSDCSVTQVNTMKKGTWLIGLSGTAVSEMVPSRQKYGYGAFGVECKLTSEPCTDKTDVVKRKEYRERYFGKDASKVFDKCDWLAPDPPLWTTDPCSHFLDLVPGISSLTKSAENIIWKPYKQYRDYTVPTASP